MRSSDKFIERGITDMCPKKKATVRKKATTRKKTAARRGPGRPRTTTAAASAGATAGKTLAAEQTAVRNATAAVKKLVSREDVLRQKVKDARAKAATSTRASSKNALVRARDAFSKVRQSKLAAQDTLRNAKAALRAQVQGSRAGVADTRAEERKAKAKDKAVAAFVKKWERDYDRIARDKAKAKAASGGRRKKVSARVEAEPVTEANADVGAEA